MPIGAVSNQADFERALDAFASNLNLARMRSANELRDQATTAGLREIAAEYDIGPRTFEKYTTETNATPARFEATINAKGKGFPLFVFDPRQTREGVSVKVKGVRRLIRRAFIARMPNGHVGVFARGVYGQPSFKFQRGKHRRTGPGKSSELPIAELYSWAPSDALSNPSVVAVMNDRVVEQQARVIERNVRFAARGR